ncbi:hypothetical protein [Nocardia lijiangensis]|uniref:hypothetical protein n=1 Tax=Nocardia lijiangensis TaxID=299618 RepID=UPI0008328265|nr:hypothetical protein [Nocardia lijiangensis]
MADSHSAAGKRTYAYAFGWRSPALARQLGATHIVELPFVFDNLLPTFQGADGLLGTPAPAALAARVHRAWVDKTPTDVLRNSAIPGTAGPP